MNHRNKTIELFFWMLMPAMICLLLFIVCMIPKHLWGFSAFMPLLPLIPVFYWGMLQAKEMPYWFAFILGLLSDATSGTPLGLSAMLYVFFLATTHTQHKYIHKEGFVIIWGYFTMILGGCLALQWVMMSFSGAQYHSIGPAVLQWLLTVCCYPLFHKGFNVLSEYIHLRRWKLIHV